MNIRDRDSRRGREQQEDVPHLYVWVYIQDCPGFTRTCIARGSNLRARALDTFTDKNSEDENATGSVDTRMLPGRYAGCVAQRALPVSRVGVRTFAVGFLVTPSHRSAWKSLKLCRAFVLHRSLSTFCRCILQGCVGIVWFSRPRQTGRSRIASFSHKYRNFHILLLIRHGWCGKYGLK